MAQPVPGTLALGRNDSKDSETTVPSLTSPEVSNSQEHRRYPGLALKARALMGENTFYLASTLHRLSRQDRGSWPTPMAVRYLFASSALAGSGAGPLCDPSGST